MNVTAKEQLLASIAAARKTFDGLLDSADVREGLDAERKAFEELGERAQESDKGTERNAKIEELDGLIDDYESAYDGLESAITALEEAMKG